MKKLISILLVSAMLFSFTSLAYAQETPLQEEETSQSETENPEEPEQEEPQQEDPNEIVADFYVVSKLLFFPFAGHAWIYCENLSDETLKVGLYDVPPGEGVSVGCISFTARDGLGIYYNIESWREKQNNNESNYWSKKKSLTRKEVDNLTNALLSYPNMWMLYFDCAFFAYTIWNSVTGQFLIPCGLPGFSNLSVMIGGQKGACKMYQPREDQVFRQVGSGSSASLKAIDANRY